MKLPAASCRVSRGNNSFISPHPNPLPKERELKGNPVASYREWASSTELAPTSSPASTTSAHTFPPSHASTSAFSSLIVTFLPLFQLCLI